MAQKKYELGLVGLGVMGRNLLLNMADSGFAVAGYDKNAEQVDTLMKESKDYDMFGAKTVKTFVKRLESPRRILLLVPAGKIVDYVIADLLPHLDKGDIIIDGGNSHFPDTTRRQEALEEKGIHFIGMGISGGAAGARLGPSMMPGGNRQAYNKIKKIMEAVSAKVDGEPCIAYLGSGSGGHYVKMVHNGIEYGLMQLLGETYDIMKRGLGFSNTKISKHFEAWNEAELSSFLVEITYKIFKQKEKGSRKHLIDLIMDASKSKGTGKWTSQDAMNLGTPVPSIDIAVGTRYLSRLKDERVAASKILKGPSIKIKGQDKDEFIEKVRNTLYFCFIVTYAQGMAQLREASNEYKYKLDLEKVARIWRGGCIIRAALLEDFRKAYDRNPKLENLMVDKDIAKILNRVQKDAREVVSECAKVGLPVAAIMNCLAYYDGYRSARLSANLIQAQRDFFGSHTYERIDKKGVFHTEWETDKKIGKG